MASNLTSQVRNIAQVATAVANGDLSQEITVDARGEILELKNTINTMVEPGEQRLRALRQVRRVPVPRRRQGGRARAVHPAGDRAPERHARHRGEGLAPGDVTGRPLGHRRGRHALRRPRERYRGAIVVVACEAINSAALLLRSASDHHPQGLANSSGVVGGNYMCHLNSAVIAISKEPNPTRFTKTLGFNDWYWGSGDPRDGFDFPLGHVQTLVKSDKNILRAGAPCGVPKYVLDYIAKHALDLWVTTEDLPSPSNRVTLERDGRIRMSYTDTNGAGLLGAAADIQRPADDLARAAVDRGVQVAPASLGGLSDEVCVVVVMRSRCRLVVAA